MLVDKLFETWRAFQTQILESRIKRHDRDPKAKKDPTRHKPQRLRLTRKISGSTRSSSGLATATNAIHKAIMKKLKEIPRKEMVKLLQAASARGEPHIIRIPISDLLTGKSGGQHRNLIKVFGRIPDLQEIVIRLTGAESGSTFKLTAGKAAPIGLSPGETYRSPTTGRGTLRLDAQINMGIWLRGRASNVWNVVNHNLRYKTQSLGLFMNTITHELTHFFQPTPKEMIAHLTAAEGMTPDEAAAAVENAEKIKARTTRAGYTGRVEGGYKLDVTRVPSGQDPIRVSFKTMGNIWTDAAGMHTFKPHEIEPNFKAVYENARKSGRPFMELWLQWLDDTSERYRVRVGASKEQWTIIDKELKQTGMRQAEALAKKWMPQYLNSIRQYLGEITPEETSPGPKPTGQPRELPKQPPHQKVKLTPKGEEVLSQAKSSGWNKALLAGAGTLAVADLAARLYFAGPHKTDKLGAVLQWGADMALWIAVGPAAMALTGTAWPVLPIAMIAMSISTGAWDFKETVPLKPEDPRWFTPGHKLEENKKSKLRVIINRNV
jgi:hypothetical protein